MANEFRLQDPGEGIHEAEILGVEVSEGDEVEEGDVLFEIETDKAKVEVPSPFSGRVEDVRVSEGDTVQVGDVLLTWSDAEAAPEDEDGEEGDEPSAGEAEEPEDEDQEEGEPETDEEQEGEEEDPEGEADEEHDGEKEAESEGEKEAESEGEEEEEPEDPEDEKEPSGEAGEGEKPSDRTEEGTEAEHRKEGEPREGPVPAAPATRRLARELGVDLREVDGSGPGGRVTRDDVKAAAEGEAPPGEDAPEEKPEPEAEKMPSREASGLPDFTRWGDVERVALRSIRKATARRMTVAWERIPHVTHFDQADVTELEEFRRDAGAEVEEAGGKLTITAFVLKAVAAALREHPRFNASLDVDAGEIVLKRYLHVGVAVDTERGLVVPVIRDVDRRSLVEVAVELTNLSGRARDGELTREEMQGGCFTVTNPGPIGGIAFTPIINHPEVAILGIGRGSLQPVFTGDEDGARTELRHILPLSLAFDHRVNDGADAARFMNTVIESLGDPRSFLLHV